MSATSTTAANVNARDAAILAILSDESSRKAIGDALSIALSVTQPNTDVIESFSKALTLTIRYTMSADGRTVTDEQTGLTWQKDGSPYSMKFASAEKYIAKLNADSFGGFSDWRLPSDHELCSIVDRSRFNPAIDPSFACRNDWYWTATPYASSSGYVWGVYFSSGGGVYGLLYRDYLDACVRAVRGGASPAGQ